MKKLRQIISRSSTLANVLIFTGLCALGVCVAAITKMNLTVLDTVFALFASAALAANILIWPRILRRPAAAPASAINTKPAPAAPTAQTQTAAIPLLEHCVPLAEVAGMPEAEPITGLEHLLENYPFAPLRTDIFTHQRHTHHGIQ